jgi:hypothetical protein
MLIAVMLVTMSPIAMAGQGRGGVMGFIAGCCFGVRTGGDYNEGKEVHWREWIMLVPIANIVFAIWNGIEGAEGVTTAELASRYGAMYY